MQSKAAQQETKNINFLIDNVDNVRKLSSSLFEQSPVSYFSFLRIFDNGDIIDFSTSGDWSKCFYDREFHKKTMVARLKVGINYLEKIESKGLIEAEIFCKEHFDITNRIEFINKHPGFFDLFSFGTTKKNYDIGTKYYKTHLDKLLKFSSFFICNSQKMIMDGYQYRINLPKYECPENKLKRVFHKEMSENGSDLSLSSQEFLVLILYAGGSSAQQIADMLYKSVKTIETYVARIKEKTGYKDRRSFNMLVYERGWNDLLGFFLPYMETDSVH